MTNPEDVVILHPTKEILISCSAFETTVANMVFPSRYGVPEAVYSGKVLVCYDVHTNEISYIDRVENNGTYLMAMEKKSVPKRFKLWFEDMRGKGNVYVNITMFDHKC